MPIQYWMQYDQNNVEQPLMVFGPPTVTRNRVTQLIDGGLAGVTYKLTSTVQPPSSGETLVARGSLLVQSPI